MVKAKVNGVWVEAQLLRAYPDGDSLVAYAGQNHVVSEWEAL